MKKIKFLNNNRSIPELFVLKPSDFTNGVNSFKVGTVVSFSADKELKIIAIKEVNIISKREYYKYNNIQCNFWIEDADTKVDLHTANFLELHGFNGSYPDLMECGVNYFPHTTYAAKVLIFTNKALTLFK